MIYLLVLSAAISVALVVLAFGEAVPSRPKQVDDRIATIYMAGGWKWELSSESYEDYESPLARRRMIENIAAGG